MMFEVLVFSVGRRLLLLGVIVGFCFGKSILTDASGEDLGSVIEKMKMQMRHTEQEMQKHVDSYAPTSEELTCARSLKIDLSDAFGIGFCRDNAWSREYEETNRNVSCLGTIMDPQVVSSFVSGLEARINRIVSVDLMPLSSPVEGLAIYGRDTNVLVISVYDSGYCSNMVAVHKGYYGRIGEPYLVANSGTNMVLVFNNPAVADMFREMWTAMREIVAIGSSVPEKKAEKGLPESTDKPVQSSE